MKNIIKLIPLLCILAGCSDDPVEEKKAELRLSRRPGGRFAVELINAERDVRALQVKLHIAAGSSFTIEDAQPAAGLRLDTVRSSMFGSNTAILFAGDKRGVLLPRSGDVATFVVHSDGGGDGVLSMMGAIVSGDDGKTIDVALGPSVSVR